MLTTNQVAERLGLTRRAVLAMITSGRLKAERFGAAWQINESDLEQIEYRKVGRPRKHPPLKKPGRNGQKAAAADVKAPDVQEPTRRIVDEHIP